MEPLIKIKSKYSFDETVNNILNSLKSKNIAVFATIDHQKNAENVNIKMEPEKLILFGSPAVGTPLMNENPDIGIELPSKLLIYKKNEITHIVYRNPEMLKNDYGIDKSKDYIMKLKTLIESIVSSLS